MVPSLLIRIAIASVWLYEGLYCKVLGKVPHQADVMSAHPLFSAKSTPHMLKLLGVVEILLGVWVLSGIEPFWCAAVQTALIVFLNANGLIFSRRFIPDPGEMVVKNFALVVLMWVSVERG